MQIELTQAQREALQRFSAKYGRNWKAQLIELWASGKDDARPDGALLRQLRNVLGPDGLMALALVDTDSPFLREYGGLRHGTRNRDRVLQQLVLHLWNQEDYPAPSRDALKREGVLDIAHEMRAYHAEHGRGDKTFTVLAQCLARGELASNPC